MDWNLNSLTPIKYGCIIADPPWKFKTYSDKGWVKSPMSQYKCADMASLAAMPVSQLARPDCALIMWATFPMMPEALALMAAWGFTYKIGGAWAKQSSTGSKWAFGAGYILRSATELFIIGTLGKPKIRSRAVCNLIVAPVREHSRKPDAMHDLAEALFHGPYCELFARQQRPGWDV